MQRIAERLQRTLTEQNEEHTQTHLLLHETRVELENLQDENHNLQVIAASHQHVVSSFPDFTCLPCGRWIVESLISLKLTKNWLVFERTSMTFQRKNICCVSLPHVVKFSGFEDSKTRIVELERENANATKKSNAHMERTRYSAETTNISNSVSTSILVAQGIWRHS
jgi:hypothetical protein